VPVFDSVLDGSISGRNKVQSEVTSCNSKKPGVCQESRYFWRLISTCQCIVVSLDCL